MEDVEDVLALIGFILMSVAGTAFGVYAMLRPDEAAEYFRRQSTPRSASRAWERVYSRQSMRVAAVSFLIVGPLFVIVGAMAAASLIAKG
jgi:hypothetical protein